MKINFEKEWQTKVDAYIQKRKEGFIPDWSEVPLTEGVTTSGNYTWVNLSESHFIEGFNDLSKDEQNTVDTMMYHRMIEAKNAPLPKGVLQSPMHLSDEDKRKIRQYNDYQRERAPQLQEEYKKAHAAAEKQREFMRVDREGRQHPLDWVSRPTVDESKEEDVRIGKIPSSFTPHFDGIQDVLSELSELDLIMRNYMQKLKKTQKQYNFETLSCAHELIMNAADSASGNLSDFVTILSEVDEIWVKHTWKESE